MGQMVTHTRAEEYRGLAQECLTAARLGSIEEAQSTFVEMARSWFRVAEEQDGESADVEGPVPPSPVRLSRSHSSNSKVQSKDE
jgi:hypothetical protein